MPRSTEPLTQATLAFPYLGPIQEWPLRLYPPMGFLDGKSGTRHGRRCEVVCPGVRLVRLSLRA